MDLITVLAERKISQRRLSIMAGIAQQDLNQAINGKKYFFPSWRRKIAEVLEMSEEDLFPEFIQRKET